jgi:UDP-N-acetyl-D-mannosaminuronate dehydrogenase
MRQVAARPERVARRALDVLARTGAPAGRVLLVGMAYKPGVSDHRESPATRIAAELAAAGVPVDYHDPLVPVVDIPGVGARSSVDRPVPGDYALAVVATVHGGHDYGWLDGVAEVLDATYRLPVGGRRWLP